MRLIDADDLLERLRNAEAFFKHETAGDFDTGRALGLNEARQKVAELPTIEAEPVKRGWWEVQELAPEKWKFCSDCGYANKRGTKWDYCPSCGARMRGGDEE